jgi:hypothetical protein
MAMAGRPLPVAAAPAPTAAAHRTAHSRPGTTVRHRAAAPVRPSRATRHTPSTAPATLDPAEIQRLAGADGVLTALVLAPVGIG